jgi:hypothetical protein
MGPKSLAAKRAEFETEAGDQSPVLRQIFGLCRSLAVMSRDSRQPTGLTLLQHLQ